MITQPTIQRSVDLARILSVYLVVTVLFSLLTSHLFSLQVLRHDEFTAKYKNMTRKVWTWTGNRGCIYDRHGNLLAGNLPCKTILADLTRFSTDPGERDEIQRVLTHQLDIDPEMLLRRFESGRSEVVVKKSVALDMAARLGEMKLRGIRIVDQQQRYYPKGIMAANVLGFTDVENQGQFGLEQRWDQDLRPRTITRVVDKDVRGRIISRDTWTPPEPIDGNDLYLTIEEPIQHVVEQELGALVDKYHPKYAYAIMANPTSGAIMAIAQYPSFDPNHRTSMAPDRWTCHFLSDVFDPGSIMKSIAIAGAIDYGIVSLNTVFDCENGIWYYAKRPLRDAGHSYGLLPVAEIVQKSSNIGTAKIALQMGENRLYQTLRRFGFGERTGLQLGNESPGILRSLPTWDGLSVTRFPIGQGISVTAIQMVQAYCALANEGNIMQLHLVDRTYDHSAEKSTYIEPMFKRSCIRPGTAKKIISAMQLVTQEGGTAETAAVEGYSVAGKTGTSQKLVDGSYEGHHKYVASFIGFVPAENPAFVLMIVADEPQGAYYGGTVAAPAFSRIADQTLRYLGVPPNELAQN